VLPLRGTIPESTAGDSPEGPSPIAAGRPRGPRHTAGHAADQLLELLVRARVAGPKVHDARIAALCLDHGVSELWTVDRDFSRFPLVTRNPLAS
jgi:predicted nucleic acid-binding protein